MNIAVIAANGRSGQVFVKAALEAGHSIRAGVRGESRLSPDPKLAVIKCDATNQADLKKLISGCDAVVSLIGHVTGSPADVQTVAMQKLILAMNEAGLKRLVSLTGTGVRFDGDSITLTDRFLNTGISIVDPKRIKDGKAAAVLLRKSDLDWTLIRVLKLQNVGARPYVLRASGPTKKYVGRSEVAQAILEVLQKNSFINQAPIISN